MLILVSFVMNTKAAAGFQQSSLAAIDHDNSFFVNSISNEFVPPSTLCF